jgi:hypothetical protein
LIQSIKLWFFFAALRLGVRICRREQNEQKSIHNALVLAFQSLDSFFLRTSAPPRAFFASLLNLLFFFIHVTQRRERKGRRGNAEKRTKKKLIRMPCTLHTSFCIHLFSAPPRLSERLFEIKKEKEYE